MDKPCPKVVARLRNGNLVKGYLTNPPGEPSEAFRNANGFTSPELIAIRPLEAGDDVSLPAETLKALFFVKSFEGNKDYPEVKFFDKTPPIRGLWVRIRFFDNESIEGNVENSIHHLVDSGFFMKPPDPRSNNEILYVIKSSLADFRVLGVRHEY
jgi:hypothetical protein